MDVLWLESTAEPEDDLPLHPGRKKQSNCRKRAKNLQQQKGHDNIASALGPLLGFFHFFTAFDVQ